MSVLLYANGLTEEYRPKNLVFTDEELLTIFPEFDIIKSFRLYEIPNTWCLWGENAPIDKRADEFNKLGSDILEQPCYSPILFIHDSEIDPSWKLTDVIIYSGYDDFRKEMLKFFDDIAADILNENERLRKQTGSPPRLLILEQTGISADKRIIFNFDTKKQVDEFFIDENLWDFATKVHNFLKFSYQDAHTFAIYADKNIIIVMNDDDVDDFIKKIISFFESKENYEACSILRNTHEKWVKFKKNNPREIQEDKENPEEDKDTEKDN